MAKKDPEWRGEKPADQDPPLEEAIEAGGLEDDSSPEDTVISQSIQNLPAVEAPPGFLPNVMFQVYEVHHREKIKWVQVILLTLVLFAATLSFFVADVRAYASDNNIESFDKALSQKIEHFLRGADNFYAAFSGLLASSWQMAAGMANSILTNTSPILLILIVAGVVLLVFALRKALTASRG